MFLKGVGLYRFFFKSKITTVPFIYIQAQSRSVKPIYTKNSGKRHLTSVHTSTASPEWVVWCKYRAAASHAHTHTLYSSMQIKCIMLQVQVISSLKLANFLFSRQIAPSTNTHLFVQRICRSFVCSCQTWQHGNMYSILRLQDWNSFSHVICSRVSDWIINM